MRSLIWDFGLSVWRSRFCRFSSDKLLGCGLRTHLDGIACERLLALTDGDALLIASHPKAFVEPHQLSDICGLLGFWRELRGHLLVILGLFFVHGDLFWKIRAVSPAVTPSAPRSDLSHFPAGRLPIPFSMMSPATSSTCKQSQRHAYSLAC